MTGPATDKRALLLELLLARDRARAERDAAQDGGPAQPNADDVAVTGVACRFPGARGRDAFWRLLRDGRDAVTRVPEGRWRVWRGGGEPAQARGGFAGLLDGVDEFDAEFWRLTPAEAELMDPQQRLFVQEAWHALEDAGYGAQRLSGVGCGVFVAAGASDYGHLLQAAGLDVEAHAFTGLSPSVLAGRIAYQLDLRGPCMTMDTACSSSLVAVTLAWQSIRRGEAELAVAGGAFTMTTPEMALRVHAAGIASPRGRCRAFDATADGIVLGEGVGVVVLKPLARAVADRDHIYGVIRGAGINQDGRTNGITAPSARAQCELERMVYAQAAIDPRQIGYVEAHGTGTALGDPIEVKALREAFGGAGGAPWCALGSVKTNIGHTTMAAGVASFIKVLLALEHEQLPPSLHFERANPRLELEGSPFFVNQRAEPWPRDGTRPRIGAVSAFGFSGTNCHVVVSDAPRAPRSGPDRLDHLVAISARTHAALAQRCAELAAHVADPARPCALGDLAFSLLVGRTHLEVRAAFVVASIEELAARLTSPVATPAGGVAEHAAARHWLAAGAPASIEPAQRRAWLEQLAELYVADRDHDVAWHKLYEGRDVRRVSVPDYPFAPDRHWVASGSDHRETVQLTGDEPFLAEHRVVGRRTLPAAAFLAFAHRAGARALGAQVRRLRDVVLGVPFAIAEPAGEIHELQVLCDRARRRFEIASAAGLHASGALDTAVDVEPPVFDRAAIERRCGEVVAPERVYEHLRAHGLEHGVRMRGIVAVARGPAEALLALAPSALDAGDRDALDAARLDVVLQGVAALLLHVGPGAAAHLPFAIGELDLHGPLADARWVHVRSRAASGGASYSFDLTVAGSDGRVLACIREFGLRSAGTGSRPQDVLHAAPRWIEAPLAASAPIAGPVLALVDDDRIEAQLRAALGALRVVAVRHGDRFERLDRDRYVIRPDVPDDQVALLADIGALPHGLVHLWCVGPAPTGDPLLAVRSLFHGARAWLAGDADAVLRIVFAYGGPAAALPCAAIGAFARSVRRETPRLDIAT
ncbi:MAG TPA: beta-ketoacyl synthase N-terminal-like domain-containing protein, partial [Kofleriaceae bacterium]|nr:beta-ketoacyl synthase N-terminal-like domain-containing protein [Kofleriaceae bacterium]